MLECYLRCYLNDEQDGWAELLSSAEWAINNSRNSTIDAVPFQVVYSYKPSMRRNLGIPSSPESGEKGPFSIYERAKVNTKEVLAVRKHL